MYSNLNLRSTHPPPNPLNLVPELILSTVFLFRISTFVCPTEIIAFNDRIAEFKAIDTEIVACSVDSKYTHLAWLNTPRSEGGLGGLDIPLLSDITKQISKDYGVLLEDAGHTLR